jgi:hypothetical protein
MSVLSPIRPILLLAAVVAGAPAAWSAEAEAAPATAGSSAASAEISDRLFLAFAQDAALVKSQWWEGQLQYSDASKGTPVDSFVLRGVLAFRPIKTLEVGGSFGVGDTSTSVYPNDGFGAIDLQAYGKWVFPKVSEGTDLAAGMILTVPTGDDAVGLGFNSFASQAFGSVRHELNKSVVLGGHVGFCLNGDGEFEGFELDGKFSYEMGFSALFPLANDVSLVAEAGFQTARFDNNNPGPNNLIGAETAASVLGGINWRAFGRGMFRGAVSFGLAEGSPDFSALLSYAYTF